MRASYDGSQVLSLDFESSTEMEAFVAGIERESGFLVDLGSALKLHQVATVSLRQEAISIEFEGQVAQVFDKGPGQFGTAFLIAEPGEPRRLLEAGPSDASEPADGATSGEVRGTSPIHRIKQMNPRQKAILATKAGRTERQILLRDSSPQVLQGLLNNPRIEEKEVVQIARSSHVVAPLLQRIASDSRWNGNQELLAIIARHPKTPGPFATRLLPNLRVSDLRIMSKMSTGPKEMVRKAALREYMRRTGQRI